MPKKLYYKVQILPTTIYNYKDMSKLYKEQSAVGGSKILANVALGQSQASVLATARFENEILDVSNLFQSKQQKEEAKAKLQSNNNNNVSNEEKQKDTEKVVEKKKVGRQEKPDDQKSSKTIQNIEAMS